MSKCPKVWHVCGATDGLTQILRHYKNEFVLFLIIKMGYIHAVLQTTPKDRSDDDRMGHIVESEIPHALRFLQYRNVCIEHYENVIVGKVMNAYADQCRNICVVLFVNEKTAVGAYIFREILAGRFRYVSMNYFTLVSGRLTRVGPMLFNEVSIVSSPGIDSCYILSIGNTKTQIHIYNSSLIKQKKNIDEFLASMTSEATASVLPTNKQADEVSTITIKVQDYNTLLGYKQIVDAENVSMIRSKLPDIFRVGGADAEELNTADIESMVENRKVFKLVANMAGSLREFHERAMKAEAVRQNGAGAVVESEAKRSRIAPVETNVTGDADQRRMTIDKIREDVLKSNVNQMNQVFQQPAPAANALPMAPTTTTTTTASNMVTDDGIQERINQILANRHKTATN